ncbi:MAG TPA: nucleosidase [Mycobacteriales bacterium]|nr:nucleosidase [Mycobacteriales bacterium]
MTVLVVAALEEEIVHLPNGVDVLVTGVGKARAAAGLARRLADQVPDVVVNIGTAGAVDGVITGLVEVNWVTQHDFPYDVIEAVVGTSIDRGFVLAPHAPPQVSAAPTPTSTALATGDMFVANADDARRLATAGIHLVDMEAFAYASVCAAFGVALRCVKVVSDAADEDAGASWLDTIDACARSLGDWVSRNITTG